MPRVLLLFEYATLNGGEQSLLALLPGLISQGYAFHALAPSVGPLAEALAKLDIEVSPLGTRSPDPGNSQDAMRARIRAALDRVKPDLVHANSLSMGRFAGPDSAAASVPSISHLRDIIRLSGQAVADLNRHTRLLAVSGATRDHHVEQGIDAAKTFVAYNGVDLARFQPRPATGWLHHELGIARDAILIGTIGQLVLRKGHDVLAAAAHFLANTSPRLDYVLIGECSSTKAEAREHEAQLRAGFSGGPLAGRAHFLGVRSDVDQILPELTLLVHPARQEPLGRVLLEAAATGIPVVATDVGGTREIFSLDAAVLVAPNDPAALAIAMRTLLDNAALREKQAAAALARVRAQFDARLSAETLARHYAAVLADPRTSSAG